MNVLISYVTLLLVVDISQGISINSVLRLSCKGCVPKLTECCIGTAVSPNYVLTTNYCAQVCQAVERDNQTLLIKQSVIYPKPQTFVINYSFNGPNTVAIIEVDMKENISYSYVDATTEDIPTTIGLNVVVPVLHDPPLFKTLVTKPCNKNYDYVERYYICAADADDADCNMPQGTPLFSNDQLLGITGMQDFITCQYSQIRFLAVAPLRYWIRYQLNDNLLNKRDKVNSDENRLRGRSINNAKDLVFKSILRTIRNKTSKPSAGVAHKDNKNNFKKKPAKMLNLNTTKTKNALKTTRKPKGYCACSTVIESGKIKKNKVKERSVQTIKHKNRDLTNKLKTNFIREYKDSQMKPHNVQTNKKSSLFGSKLNTLTAQTTSTITMASNSKAKGSKSNQEKRITSALDWFNQMRNKVKTDNSSVLILSTTRISQGEFVDLT